MSTFDIAVPDLGGRPLCAETSPDVWFPDNDERTTSQAKAICGRCPVIVTCLTFALDNDEAWGVWGGLSPRERSRLRRAA